MQKLGPGEASVLRMILKSTSDLLFSTILTFLSSRLEWRGLKHQHLTILDHLVCGVQTERGGACLPLLTSLDFVTWIRLCSCLYSPHFLTQNYLSSSYHRCMTYLLEQIMEPIYKCLARSLHRKTKKALSLLNADVSQHSTRAFRECDGNCIYRKVHLVY